MINWIAATWYMRVDMCDHVVKLLAALLLLSLVNVHAATVTPIVDETALTTPQASAAPIASQKLQLSSSRDGIYPYLPGANYRISIRVPEEAIQEGWRCCWIDAFSRDTAKQLSAQYRKPVLSNDADVIFDAARAEASLRQIAPSLFEGYLPLASSRRAGSYAAKLYVHLYRNDGNGDDMRFDEGIVGGSSFERGRYRYARNFLDEPVLTVRFAYASTATSPERNSAPPSQLLH